MNFKPKFVRFQDWSPSRFVSSDEQFVPYRRGTRATVSGILERIQEGFATVLERIQSWRNSLCLPSKTKRPWPSKDSKNPRKKILDPQDSFLQKWNRVFLASIVLAIALDPFFFYIPVISREKTCLDLDTKLEVVACVLRSIIDIFYILHIIFEFRTGYFAPFSRVFSRGELIESPSAIAKRYLSTYFIVDILSILPFPQLVILIMKYGVKGPVSLHTKDLLKYVVFSQFVPRIYRIYPLYKQVTATSGIITQTAWAGAVSNLCLYMLASHIVGAIWYLIAVERQDTCWVKKHALCPFNRVDLYCGASGRRNNITQADYDCLNAACPLTDPGQINNDTTTFNFGIFFDALQSHVVEQRKDFVNKIFYCFWWGLRNLRFVLLNCNHVQLEWLIPRKHGHGWEVKYPRVRHVDTQWTRTKYVSDTARHARWRVIDGQTIRHGPDTFFSMVKGRTRFVYI